MTTFVFNPSHGRETLEAFNARVKHFCTTKDCMSAEVGALGNSLILNLTSVDDLDLAVEQEVDIDFFLPVVFEIDDADKMLEEHITEMFDGCEVKSNKDPILPISQQFVKGSRNGVDGAQKGFLIILCDIGGQTIVGEEDLTNGGFTAPDTPEGESDDG